MTGVTSAIEEVRIISDSEDDSLVVVHEEKEEQSTVEQVNIIEEEEEEEKKGESANIIKSSKKYCIVLVKLIQSLPANQFLEENSLCLSSLINYTFRYILKARIK